MSEILSCQKLGKAYPEGRSKRWVLKDVDLTLNAGEMLTVMGRSGSGKSTLLHCLSGLESFDQGKVLWLGRSLKSLSAGEKREAYRRDIGFVYQLHYLLSDLSAIENVMLPLEPLNLSLRAMKVRASELLKNMGLCKIQKHPVEHLSGGERQRVALARALIHDPKWVFLDEPTASLDASNRDRLIDLIKWYQREKGVAFLIATHDQELAKASDRVLDL